MEFIMKLLYKKIYVCEIGNLFLIKEGFLAIVTLNFPGSFIKITVAYWNKNV